MRRGPAPVVECAADGTQQPVKVGGRGRGQCAPQAIGAERLARRALAVGDAVRVQNQAFAGRELEFARPVARAVDRADRQPARAEHTDRTVAGDRERVRVTRLAQASAARAEVEPADDEAAADVGADLERAPVECMDPGGRIVEFDGPAPEAEQCGRDREAVQCRRDAVARRVDVEEPGAVAGEPGNAVDVAADLLRRSEQVRDREPGHRGQRTLEQLVLQPGRGREVGLQHLAAAAVVAQGLLEHAGALDERATHLEQSLTRPQARRQFLGAIGLGDEVVGARLQALDQVLELVARGHKHGVWPTRRVAAADGAAQVEPREGGQLPVGDQYVGWLAGQQRQRLGTVRSEHDLESESFEDRGEPQALEAVVLDREGHGASDGRG